MLCIGNVFLTKSFTVLCKNLGKRGTRLQWEFFTNNSKGKLHHRDNFSRLIIRKHLYVANYTLHMIVCPPTEVRGTRLYIPSTPSHKRALSCTTRYTHLRAGGYVSALITRKCVSQGVFSVAKSDTSTFLGIVSAPAQYAIARARCIFRAAYTPGSSIYGARVAAQLTSHERALWAFFVEYHSNRV